MLRVDQTRSETEVSLFQHEIMVVQTRELFLERYAMLVLVLQRQEQGSVYERVTMQVSCAMACCSRSERGRRRVLRLRWHMQMRCRKEVLVSVLVRVPRGCEHTRPLLETRLLTPKRQKNTKE